MTVKATSALLTTRLHFDSALCPIQECLSVTTLLSEEQTSCTWSDVTVIMARERVEKLATEETNPFPRIRQLQARR